MLNYQCKIENKSDIQRELTISIEPASIQAVMEEEFKTVQKQAQIKGFRQGKVPMSLIKQYYEGDVKNSTMRKLIRESYEKALNEKDLYPIGTPEFEPKAGSDMSGTEKFIFTAKIEVMPEIKLNDLSKIKLTRESSKVEKKELDEALTRLQEAQAEITTSTADRGAVKKGDLIEISFSGTIDGEALNELKAEHRLAEIGAGHFMKEFEDNLIGMKKGETKEFPLSFDDKVGNEKLAKKTAQMKVEVLEFKDKKLPELDDEFAKRFQKDTIAEFKNEIKERIEADKKEGSETNLREELFKQLIESHKFEVPKNLVLSQLSYLMKQEKRFSPNENNTEHLTQLMTLAEKQVRVFLILRQVSKENKIEVVQKDLEHEYSRLATQSKMDVQEVTKFYDGDSDAKQQLKAKLLEDKTIEHILSLASVKNDS